ncbi:uncharacterized protein LOC119090215 [Pollicipes pollicipes]|uniref:uncharacterized protein LOC119090215 n=1 Tax=Pollicipes pollicipes TaxID=41117 RepID=UPI001885929D|nr:uncharacterized protein LOC119090215 [Pollicipes pollicipes]
MTSLAAAATLGLLLLQVSGLAASDKDGGRQKDPGSRTGDLELRDLSAEDRRLKAKKWVTPFQLEKLPLEQVNSDKTLPNAGRFKIADGVTVAVTSPNYPDEYGSFIWTSWKIEPSSADAPLRLSCDTFDLAHGDYIVVRESKRRRVVLDASDGPPDLETGGALVLELRSGRRGRGRLRCSVRAGGAARPTATETATSTITTTSTPVGGTDFWWLTVTPKPVTAPTKPPTKPPTGAPAVAPTKPSTVAPPVAPAVAPTKPPTVAPLKESLLPLFNNPDGAVRPICLPKLACGGGSGGAAACFQDRISVLAGWGVLRSGSKKRPPVVHHVSVPVVTNDACSANYAADNVKITSRMLCAGLAAGGKDTCQVRQRGREGARGKRKEAEGG